MCCIVSSTQKQGSLLTPERASVCGIGVLFLVVGVAGIIASMGLFGEVMPDASRGLQVAGICMLLSSFTIFVVAMTVKKQERASVPVIQNKPVAEVKKEIDPAVAKRAQRIMNVIGLVFLVAATFFFMTGGGLFGKILPHEAVGWFVGGGASTMLALALLTVECCRCSPEEMAVYRCCVEVTRIFVECAQLLK